MSKKAGCLLVILMLLIFIGEAVLLSGNIGNVWKDDSITWLCVFLAIVFDVFIVVYIIKRILDFNKAKKEADSWNEIYRVKNAIQNKVSLALQEPDKQIRFADDLADKVSLIDDENIDFMVLSCIKTYNLEVYKISGEIKTICKKLNEIIESEEHLLDWQKLDFIRSKAQEIEELKIALNIVQRKYHKLKIVFTFDDTSALKDIRYALSTFERSQKIQSLKETPWKSISEIQIPKALENFKCSEKSVTIQLGDFVCCLFSCTILLFLENGAFVTALKPSALKISTQPCRASIHIKNETYSEDFVANDSKIIEEVKKNTQYILEYGRVNFSIGDREEIYFFSSQYALDELQKATKRYCKPSYDSNTSNHALINLFSTIAPRSNAINNMKELYAKSNPLLKKYCYIERS